MIKTAFQTDLNRRPGHGGSRRNALEKASGNIGQALFKKSNFLTAVKMQKNHFGAHFIYQRTNLILF
jgi:hypothetical protein